jgi:hypothetical protein
MGRSPPERRLKAATPNLSRPPDKQGEDTLMSRPITDYRAILHSKPNFQSVRGVKLRTRRRHGDVEILRDKDGEWKRFRHGHGFEEAVNG